MDDDYEIRSNPSPVSGSPTTSPRENRRVTVTVASPAPSLPAANSLALALPIQQQARGSNGGSGGSGGREDCWSEDATAVLIDAWGERYLELNRGNLKQKHWKEVADVVNSRDDYTKTPKTDIQCKNRIDTVKKRYKTEKAKISDGGGITTSKWKFFDRLDQLIGPTAKIPNATGISTVSNSNSPLQKVPLGIPVILHTGGVGGGANQYLPQRQQQQIQLKNRKIQFHQCDLPENSDSPVSSDSYPPPEGNERKRRKVLKEKERGKKRKDWGNAMSEMSKAIIKFGEVYEQTETSKVKQIVEMENQRMQFVKDLELQRMQFFMKIQSEISQLMDPTNHHSNNSKDNSNGGNNHNKDNNNGGNNNDNNNHNNNNSDSE